MKTELEKQLHEAELEKLRAIDKIKQIKAQIEEANKEPSIFELMPIGSVWCGWRVVSHREDSLPVYLAHDIAGWTNWTSLNNLHKLIAEQRKLDAMKKAADAVVKHLKTGFGVTPWLAYECHDYKTIINQEANEAKENPISK